MSVIAKSDLPATTLYWALQNTLGVWATGRETHEVAVRAILAALAQTEDPGPVLDVYTGYVALELGWNEEKLGRYEFGYPSLQRDNDRSETILQALALITRIFRQRDQRTSDAAADLNWAYRKAADDIREMDLILRSHTWAAAE